MSLSNKYNVYQVEVRDCRPQKSVLPAVLLPSQLQRVQLPFQTNSGACQ